MLYWALVFFIFSVLSALFAFGGIAPGAETVSRTLFFVFLLLHVLTLVCGVNQEKIG